MDANLVVMSDERKKTWLDVAKEFPMVSPVIAFGAAVVHEWNLHSFEEFLYSIRVRLDLDGDQLAARIQEHRNKKWMAEGLAQGWKAIQETMDPLARRCAESMVAEYLRDEKTPDRFHRKFADFFKESDAQILAMTLHIVEALEEEEATWAGLVLMKSAYLDRPSLGGVHMFFDTRNQPRVFGFGNDFFYEAWDVLLKHALVSPWVGGDLEHKAVGVEVEENIGLIDARQVERLRVLGSYLKPLKHEIMTTGHAVEK